MSCVTTFGHYCNRGRRHGTKPIFISNIKIIKIHIKSKQSTPLFDISYTYGPQCLTMQDVMIFIGDSDNHER